MKKILVINTTFNTGGAARVAKDLFDEMSKNFEVHFAYGRGNSGNNEKHCFKFGNKIEFFLHAFLVRFFGLEGFGSYYSTKKLIKFIEKEKFELIHLHNLHGYYLNFFKLIKFLQQEKIPVIWTLHDEWATTWLPAYSEHNKLNFSIKNWFINKNIYPKNYFPIFKGFMLKRKNKIFSNNWNPTIICPSEWLKSKIKLSYLNKYNVEVIYNGINTEIFKPSKNKTDLRIKYGLPIDSNIVFFAAANFNDKRKGISDIVDAIKILNNDNYFFLGAGSGKIEQLNNLKIVGYVDDKNKLAELYGLSDIFCFASSAETFLLTVAESLSCGTPVVGYKIPVVSEIFREDVGVLVDAGNKELLARSIDYLLKDGQKRLQMGEIGRKLVLEKYSQNIFYNKYFELYNK